ncbi:reverse transcriptase domain-containing protein [Primorskyibacter flagellatus]|uniref:reverse transcriptase domain-containing protein n=1 Tax=Primorskyibacter flagellatus TaxID=1387277 RepID=UPI0022872CD8|nr:reverse transcriptase domain-containing protein [Primorskyibacter flagellatus]
MCSPRRLYAAWRYLRTASRSSQWPRVRQEYHRIEEDPFGFIASLSERLATGDFQFGKKFGYTKRKSGGSRRGIVVASLADRIVQRSILTTITHPAEGTRQQVAGLHSVISAPTSMAGVPGRSIGEAVHLAHNVMKSGATHFTCSDVKSFYPFIPRVKINQIIQTYITDDRFCDLFERAISTELSNELELGQWLDLFPIKDKGVAQGSPLSVFCANLTLSDMDKRLNNANITTVRYLDDFLILGASKRSVDEAFLQALEILDADGMDAYRPRDGSQKAWSGLVENGIDFLGCRVNSQNIGPSRRAKQALLSSINDDIAKSKRAIYDVLHETAELSNFSRKATVGATLIRTTAATEGWSEAFNFCTNRLPFHQLQAQVYDIQRRYLGWSVRQSSKFSTEQWRRVWGGTEMASTSPRRPK